MEGITLGNFIGEGKFARVYIGKNYCGEAFAVKVLKLTETSAVSKRKLLREAKELTKLDHPNIVKTIGIISEKKGFCHGILL